MAITFRGTKGSPLSHDELDQNFREFYYSSSLLGTSQSTYGLVLYRSSSLDAGETIYLPTARGDQFGIQVKSGSDNISSSFFTSSNDFTYDYVNKHLSVSGSGHFSGSVTVLGTLTATQFETVLVSSSIQYASGSNQFGNSADDVHTFTGSINHQGSQTTTANITATNFTGSSFTGSFSGSLLADNGVLSSSAQIATEISGAFTSTSASIATDITTNVVDIAALTGSFSSSVSTRLTALRADETSLRNVTGSYATTGSNSFVGNQIITGSLEATSTFTLPGFADVSASLASVIGASGISNVVEDTSPQLGGDLDLNTNTITGSGSIDFVGNLTVDGIISSSGDIIAFASSDERLKDNLTPIDGALSKINQINGYEFDWNNNSEHSGHDVGVIAQEIEKVLPELVIDRKDGYKAVRYDKIVALLISAIKEQQLQIDVLLSKQ